ncbi:MAG: hypothetical protein AAFV53_10680, partial [Myxococcota bacterium]
FLLGGLGPRAALYGLQAELDAATAELADRRAARSRSPGATLPVPGMQEMFTPPQDAQRRPARRRPARSEEDDGDDAVTPDTAEPVGDVESSRRAPENIAEEFDLAVEGQRLRAEQSRAALAEQADFSDEELKAFDQITADMNDALSVYGEDLMAVMLSGQEPDAEDMLGLTHEVTGVLYEAQMQVNDLIGDANV